MVGKGHGQETNTPCRQSFSKGFNERRIKGREEERSNRKRRHTHTEGESGDG